MLYRESVLSTLPLSDWMSSSVFSGTHIRSGSHSVPWLTFQLGHTQTPWGPRRAFGRQGPAAGLRTESEAGMETWKKLFKRVVSVKVREYVKDYCKRNGLLTLSVFAVITGCVLGFVLRTFNLSTQVRMGKRKGKISTSKQRSIRF